MRDKISQGQRIVAALRERIDVFDEFGAEMIERWIDDYYATPYDHAECIIDTIGGAMWRLVADKGKLRLSYRGFNENRQEIADEFNQEIF